MKRCVIVLACMAACSKDEVFAPDLSERLDPGEVRAGIIAEPNALFGGISAEGTVGDIKLYNHQIQVIIQGIRHGSGYLPHGGVILDADIVRAPDEPGRDVIDEYAFMPGFGWVVEPESIQVVSDGADGTAAIVRVEGTSAPMDLLNGAVETNELIPIRNARVITEYVLEPDDWFVQIHHTVEWMDQDSTIQLAELALVSADVTNTFRPGGGLDTDTSASVEWAGVVTEGNHLALALFTDDVSFEESVLSDLLEELLGPHLSGFHSAIDLTAGDTVDWSIHLGVGPDLATLTSAWHTRGDAPVEAVSGRVVDTHNDPVPGARVHLLDDDGKSLTIGTSDIDGSWNATVLEGTAKQTIATGRGSGFLVDLPPGAGWVSPLSSGPPMTISLDSLGRGAPSTAFAEGWGISASTAIGNDIVLVPPGVLAIDTTDGLPAVVRISFAEGDLVGNHPMLVPNRPNGHAVIAHLTDGFMEIPIEPGTYTVLVHRGLRWEYWMETVTVASGQRLDIDTPLQEAWVHDEVLAGDPHSHSSPSMDGHLPMSHRLITHAAHGVDVHFGTDHDQVADYRPLVEQIGIGDVLESIVAIEVSPAMRGHVNTYPVEPQPNVPNQGAVPWWERWAEWPLTSQLYAEIRELTGSDGIIQVNHARSTGMFASANYDPTTGTINNPDFWADDFDAMEVLNAGEFTELLVDYLDLVSRGWDPIAIGVSDSHTYTSAVGENVTFMYTGTRDLSVFDPAMLKETLRARATVVSRGPFIDATINGQWAPGTTVTAPATLSVTTLSPSWVTVDRVILLRDGIEVDRQLDTEATWLLEPEADAFYVVIVEGDQPMSPVYAHTPWAMTSAIRIDADGKGWVSPASPLVISN